MWTSDIRTSVPGPGSVSTSLARPSHLGRSNWTTSNAFPTLGRAFSISSCVISVLLPLGFDCGLDWAARTDGTSRTALTRSSPRAILDMSLPDGRSRKIAQLRRGRLLETRTEPAVQLTGSVSASLRNSGEHQVPGARHIHIEIHSTPED